MNRADVLAGALLVDDHPLMRAGMRTVLRRLFPDHRLAEVGCAKDALALLATRRPRLALVDVNLPGMSGLELARQIRAQDQQIKLLMVSAIIDAWTINEALAAGARGFVAKTSSLAVLPEGIRTVLAGGVFLCPDAQAALRQPQLLTSNAANLPGPLVLSQRECEILHHLAHGANTKAIADFLRISPKTVEAHRQHITRKLGTNSVALLTRYAIRHRLAPGEEPLQPTS